MLSGDQLFERRCRPFKVAVIACAAAVALFVMCSPAAPALARSTTLRPQIDLTRAPSPLLLLVSIKKQRVRVFDVNGEVASSRISTGQPGFDTPTGVFSVLEKNEYHESNIYEGAPMPFMQRLTWSGIALHAGVVPGYRASHGCIRLPASFAKSLFGITKVGSRVVVTPDELEPIPFEHPNLFKPLPAETPKAVASQFLGDETLVAANDVGASASEVPQFLGVSAALAAAARDPNAFPPDRPRSRAEADRMATEKTSKLQAALRTADALKQATSEKAKLAVKDADAANETLAKAKQSIDPMRTAVDATDKRLKQALQDFEAFMTGAAPATAAGKNVQKKAENPADREVELEEAILDLTIDAETARADVARRELDLAAAQGAVSAAETARATALENVRANQAQLRSIQTDLIEANKQIVRRNKPISVFISLNTQRIYIRQGTEPLLEAPIKLNNSGRRVGTHVFTAMRYGADPDVFDWRLVSALLPASTEPSDDDSGSRKTKRREASLPHTPEGSVRMARAALDAIKIPPDILATISDLARPGASLIVSDRELPANENGLGTEFVVLTR